MAVDPQGGVVNEDVDQDTAISEALPSAPQTDDYDDVEGHGLREVAIGVTAAAIIGGGASAALAGSPASAQPAGAGTHGVVSTAANHVRSMSHIGHSQRGSQQDPDAGRASDLSTSSTHLGSEARITVHEAAQSLQHEVADRAERAVDSAKRISSFGDQIVQGETDVVHHDAKAASKLLRNITH